MLLIFPIISSLHLSIYPVIYWFSHFGTHLFLQEFIHSLIVIYHVMLFYPTTTTTTTIAAIFICTILLHLSFNCYISCWLCLSVQDVTHKNRISSILFLLHPSHLLHMFLCCVFGGLSSWFMLGVLSKPFDSLTILSEEWVLYLYFMTTWICCLPFCCLSIKLTTYVSSCMFVWCTCNINIILFLSLYLCLFFTIINQYFHHS